MEILKTEKDKKDFVNIILNPPEPNEKLKSAYKELMEIKLTSDLEFDFENSTKNTVVIKHKEQIKEESYYLEIGEFYKVVENDTIWILKPSNQGRPRGNGDWEVEGKIVGDCGHYGYNMVYYSPKSLRTYEKISKDSDDAKWLQTCINADKYIPREEVLNPLNKLPKSFKDFVSHMTPIEIEKLNNMFSMMRILYELRDVYRMGWKHEYNREAYIIELIDSEWCVGETELYNHFFSFETKEIRDLFYDRFKDMLEKVKPLFM